MDYIKLQEVALSAMSLIMAMVMAMAMVMVIALVEDV
ncbi:hypothetical protein DSUL_20534 [Desulfovibrionales bacterium]